MVALVLLAQPSPANPVSAAPGPCALPSATPLWIEYGDALTPDVRDVFARKGVIVSLSGTAGAAYFRSHGALTTYFALHLPNLVGPLSAPADPASIPATASKLLAQAIAATGCSTPWIALNELFGSNLPAPWSGGNALYRADVLALMQQLASGGAHPVLLVHGKPTVAGATADWWRQVSQAGDIVYEAYYDADRIYALGPLIGNRRMRLGMRQILADFRGIGIAPGHLGIALGFHTEGGPGVGGRRGLQPREAWLRVVKWEALAARQVAAETRFGSIWSWGWANFSGVDPDKAAAACVYLWTRDRALCDGPAAGGSAFNLSLVEGQIVLPDGIQCSMAGGHRISIGAVRRLTALTGDAHEALTALAARAALQTAARVDPAQVRAVEQRAIARAFHGSRVAYHRALERRHATLAIAREVIRDRLRELAIARQLAQNGSDETTLQWTDDRETAFAHSLICLHDDLPGTGDFPASNELDLGVVPLPALLPFLFVDRKPPVAPAQPVATVAPGQVSLTWSYGGEPDLAGYELARATTPGGPYQTISGQKLLPRPAFTDGAAPMGQPSYYVVRA
ncbi:MAG: hypothetical protein ACXVZW_03465, partial [Gaiellaceae bacterium]